MTARTIDAPGEVTVIPTGPARSRLFGHLPHMRKDPLGLMLHAAQDFGPVTKLKLVVDVLLLNTPEDIAHVLVKGYKNYPKTTQIVRIKPIVGDGLIVSHGEQWQRQRKLAQPAFHRARLAAFAKTMADVAADTLSSWDALPDGTTIDVSTAMNRIALRVIGLTMFGRDLDGDHASVGDALDVALAVTTDRFRSFFYLPRLPTPSNLRFNRAMRTLDGLVAQIIAERHSDGVDRGDLLSMFMDARDEDTGGGMSDVQLRDEVMTMLLAGHETTSNALAWTLALLDEHKDVADTLRDEAFAALGNRPATFDDLRSLPYARRVIQESMRLRPPVWLFARSAAQRDMLPSGVAVPAGATIFVSPYTLHRDPTLWPDPERFDPNRFAPDAIAARSKTAYVPFAAGPRRCIGDEFALMEAAIVLTSIVRKYALTVAPGHKVAPEPSLTLRPKGGLPMVLHRL